MKTFVHAGAGTIAMILIAGFLTATLTSELLLDATAILAVKKAVLAGLCLLIPALAITGGSGFSLARGRHSPAIDRKSWRMKIIAANGLLVLLPWQSCSTVAWMKACLTVFSTPCRPLNCWPAPLS